ncbi:MAG TPA: hypothetical protein DDX54_06125 [Rhodospirillaceae bacterium]|jgi:uncharacterized protein YjbI with pentapeptide repeats|nr:pentapeptide repeat-containing protein [Alphaproteobacteria bacterium]HBH26961.1 hypothetical protein [Rhodospirillaceae bacterium]
MSFRDMLRQGRMERALWGDHTGEVDTAQAVRNARKYYGGRFDSAYAWATKQLLTGSKAHWWSRPTFAPTNAADLEAANAMALWRMLNDGRHVPLVGWRAPFTGPSRKLTNLLIGHTLNTLGHTTGRKSAPIDFMGSDGARQRKILERNASRLAGAPLAGANLDGGFFGKRRFHRRPNLTGADLTGASAQGTTFAGAILNSTIFTGADLEANASGTATNLERAHAKGANFDHATLTGANLKDLRGQNASFASAVMAGVDATGAILFGANFNTAPTPPGGTASTPTDLTGATFIKADLREAKMREVNAQGADFTEANLAKADLTDADLSAVTTKDPATGAVTIVARTNLTNADLRGACLDGVNLQGADISGARLSGTDLRGVTMTDIILDQNTRLSGARMTVEQVKQIRDSAGHGLGANVLADILRGVKIYEGTGSSYSAGPKSGRRIRATVDTKTTPSSTPRGPNVVELDLKEMGALTGLWTRMKARVYKGAPGGSCRVGETPEATL